MTVCFTTKKVKGVSRPLQLERVRLFSRMNMPNLPYHNFAHAEQTAQDAMIFGIMENVPYNDLYLLGVEGYVHDTGFDPRRNDNEERTAKSVQQALANSYYGFKDSELSKIGELTRSTKIPQQPTNILEQIICDADMSNLGTPSFFDAAERVRQENGIALGRAWYEHLHQLLKGHKYFTRAARTLRDEGKAKNLLLLEKIIRGEIAPVWGGS
jgi:predicted metal-dependent HD superfamily phosphohydrolase